MKDQLFNGKILFSLLAVLICLGFTMISYGQAADEAAAEEVVADDGAADDAPADEAPAEVEAPAEGEGDAPAEGEAPAEAEMPMSQMFEITLTNLTTGEHGVSGQILSPPIFVTHAAGLNLAPVGEAASPALVALAEGGDSSGLVALAAAAGANSVVADGLVDSGASVTNRQHRRRPKRRPGRVDPGASVTVTVTADAVNSLLSVAAMLGSTNDGFTAATNVALFDEAGMPVTMSLDLNAYDAGSEDNTELASDIPGPLGLGPAVDPPGTNARVPTEGGVIMLHEGIQGVGDVTEAFAWVEPTAMLTITPVEAPTEPVAPPVTKAPRFNVTLAPGLNMISIPLMPAEPYTAKSLAEMLGATVIIQLDTATRSFVGYTAADSSDGFGIDGGMGYIVNTPAGGMVKFTGSAWDNQPEPEAEPAEGEGEGEGEVVAEGEAPAEGKSEGVAEGEGEASAEGQGEVAAEGEGGVPAAPVLPTYKSAWAFVVTSDIRSMDLGTSYTLVAENLRTGAVAMENITSDVKRSSAVWADLNRKSVVEAGDKLKISLYDERGNIVSGPFQRTVATTDIRNAFLSLQLTVGDVQPQETILAQNFPNPFNPETWIPYQLNKATEVTIQLFDVSGRLVRTLDLGSQPVGSYMTPSSAAYWDGKNQVGERVASGIYFYTLQTSDFAATRRMVILK